MTKDSEIYMPVNGSDNRQSKGHALVIVGYDKNDKYFIVLNSTGPRWGDKGFCHISYDCIVDIGEAYVIDKFSGWEKISNI